MPLFNLINKLFIVGIVTIQFVCTIGCNNNDNDEVAGLCLHVYSSPVVEVDSVTDSETGKELESFRISGITIDGWEEELEMFTDEPSYGVKLVENALICEVPCGFGTIEGDYAVVVSADGYLPKTIQFEAFYEIFLGGCPSYNEGATIVSITLEAL